MGTTVGTKNIRVPIATDTPDVVRDTTNMANDVDAVFTGYEAGWTAYTPTLTAATTNPTLGTGGTAVGAYKRIGKTVIGRVRITLGTGFTVGAGTYHIGLPVTPTASLANLTALGAGSAGDIATNIRPYIAQYQIAGNVLMLQNPGLYTLLDHTGPTAAWAAGGYISATFSYETT